ncbi:MAG: hypothetical protein OXL97_02870 [Chloroflexota bacterium]|nr:hypothetical protein [Chloroflexota bacterium]MDE2885829.1 hypothetical protein [Chloroflexota bacterium]
MARYLRTIRQGRWLTQSWLTADELQADALIDLKTEGNVLSIYRVDTDLEVDRVAVALAANRGSLDNIDYAVFDDSNFPTIGLVVKQQEGETPDTFVDGLHYDLVNLTVGKLAELAQTISTGYMHRILKKDVRRRIQEGLATGKLNRSKLTTGLLNALE